MRSSYSSEDVEILLKDISGMVEPLPASVREKRIQSGTHYCEMLPLEYKPSEQYMETYQMALRLYAESTAKAVGELADRLYRKKGASLTLVSLARAGIPMGILLRRYLRRKYNISPKHYAISIIRGRGIDNNALRYILERHESKTIQFVDGWIGKGAIFEQLTKAVQDYEGLDATLAVLSDPSGLSELCGTHEDILIPSSCLNATVTGLISRTFLRNDIIGENDFHGAVYYEELAKDDLSNDFLKAIENRFLYENDTATIAPQPTKSGKVVALEIARHYGVNSITYIKPGIGEATRVLLRRVPWKIIVNANYTDSIELSHIYQLAKERNVSCEISEIDLGNYKVCGIIKQLSDI